VFNKADSFLKPTGTKAMAHPWTATNASLLSAGVACGILGAPPSAFEYFFNPGGCNRGPECFFLNVKLTAGTAPESRHAEVLIAPKKETVCNSQKGSSF
jgi:hypothetical protein